MSSLRDRFFGNRLVWLERINCIPITSLKTPNSFVHLPPPLPLICPVGGERLSHRSPGSSLQSSITTKTERECINKSYVRRVIGRYNLMDLLQGGYFYWMVVPLKLVVAPVVSYRCRAEAVILLFYIIILIPIVCYVLASSDCCSGLVQQRPISSKWSWRWLELL